MPSGQLDLFHNEESSPQAGRAKTSPWQEIDRELMRPGQDFSGTSPDSWQNYSPAGLSLRMSLISCRSTREGTWEPSSGRWLNSGFRSPTGFWTLKGSEFPSAGVESSLSDILESPGPHLSKYFLSRKACIGILRRASNRGRMLPQILFEALRKVAGEEAEEIP